MTVEDETQVDETESEELDGQVAVDEPAGEVGETETETETETPQGPSDYLVGGNSYTPAEIEAALDVHRWAASLNSEQVSAVNAALAPRKPEPEIQPEPEPEWDSSRFVDDKLADEVRKLREQNVLVSEWMQSQREAAQAQQEAELSRSFETARTETQEQLGLSDADMEALISKTEKSGIVAGMSSRYTDSKQLFGDAMNATFWSDAQFRDQAIAAAVAAERDGVVSSAQKKARAGSVSGGSAPTSRSSKPSLETKEDRDRYITDQFAKALAG